MAANLISIKCMYAKNHSECCTLVLDVVWVLKRQLS